jgi:transcriptional regulator with XRE-family HTH domain
MLGAEIRRTRKSMGMTLQEFAVHVGLPWQTLQAYEAGATMPPSDRLFKILHATRRAPEPFRVRHVARVLAAA